MAVVYNMSLDPRGWVRNIAITYIYRCRPLRVQTLVWVGWLTAEDVSLPGRGRVDTPQ